MMEPILAYDETSRELHCPAKENSDEVDWIFQKDSSNFGCCYRLIHGCNDSSGAGAEASSKAESATS
jgi:hypothetical protein